MRGSSARRVVAEGPPREADGLAARFALAAPGPFAYRSAFFASAAQAMDSALRIARAHSGRPAAIKLSGSSLPGATPAWTEFGRPAGPVFRLRAPMPLHGDTADYTLSLLDEVLHRQLRPERVAALVIEPVQAEGSVLQLDDDFLAALRHRCDLHHILLVADESACGLARSGRPFAMAHHAARADLLVHAEGPDGPLPLAVVTGRAEVMQAAPDEGPWPAGAAQQARAEAEQAMHAVLDAIEQQGLCERADALGRRLSAVLGRAMAWQPRIADIRGIGSLLAVECLAGSQPDPGFALRAQARARQRGLLLPVSGERGNVLRFPYPLGIDEAAFAALLVTVELSLRGP